MAVGGVHASLKDREGDLARATAARVPVMLLQVCHATAGRVFRHDYLPMSMSMSMSMSMWRACAWHVHVHVHGPGA